MRGIEAQDGKRGGTSRGALHDHVLLWVASPLEKADVRRWAMAAGFGHSVDLVVVQPGSKREGYYLAKYVTKAGELRKVIPWESAIVDEATGEVLGRGPERPRGWSQSRATAKRDGWGPTMAAVKAEAAAYARERSELDALLAEKRALALLAAELGVQLLDGGGQPQPVDDT